MKKSRVILVHRQIPYLKTLESELYRDFSNIEVIDLVSSGSTLITSIFQNKPDLIIADLIIEGMDSLTAIETAREMGVSSKVILTSSFISHEVSIKATELEVEHFLLNPINKGYFNMIVSQTLNFEGNEFNYAFKREDYEVIYASIIEKYMRELGFKDFTSGYRYIVHSIVTGLIDISVLDSITKILYPDVAKYFNSTASRVERVVRHSIDTTWEQEGEKMSQILGFDKKPTNMEFIKRSIYYIKENGVQNENCNF